MSLLRVTMSTSEPVLTSAHCSAVSFRASKVDTYLDLLSPGMLVFRYKKCDIKTQLEGSFELTPDIADLTALSCTSLHRAGSRRDRKAKRKWIREQETKECSFRIDREIKKSRRVRRNTATTALISGDNQGVCGFWRQMCTENILGKKDMDRKRIHRSFHSAKHKTCRRIPVFKCKQA